MLGNGVLTCPTETPEFNEMRFENLFRTTAPTQPLLQPRSWKEELPGGSPPPTTIATASPPRYATATRATSGGPAVIRSYLMGGMWSPHRQLPILTERDGLPRMWPEVSTPTAILRRRSIGDDARVSGVSATAKTKAKAAATRGGKNFHFGLPPSLVT